MINMIVAASKNDVIGKDGKLPWRIPEDLKVFKELTMDGVLFAGKNTFASLPPLKGREVVMLNRNTFPTLYDMKNDKWAGKKKWLIGGAVMYHLALELDLIDKVYLTTIDREYDGDTFFCFEHMRNLHINGWELKSERVLRENDPLVILEEWERLR